MKQKWKFFREVKMKAKGYFDVFYQMLSRELLIFRRQYVGKAFDCTFMFFNFVLVFGYFLPRASSGPAWGPFMYVGSLATFGLMEAVNARVAETISDINGDRTINYLLTMPIPSSLAFMAKAVSWAVIVFLLALILFPVGKLVIFNQFDMRQVSYGKLALMYCTLNIFYGFFALWLSGVFQKINDLGRLWCRVINPVFMFGAFFYSFKDAYQFSPLIARITLINPMVYITEGMRAAMLGQEGSLNFWLCLGVTWGFIIACGLHGIARLRRTLDCV